MIRYREEIMKALALKERSSFKAIKIMRTKPARCKRHTFLKDNF